MNNSAFRILAVQGPSSSTPVNQDFCITNFVLKIIVAKKMGSELRTHQTHIQIQNPTEDRVRISPLPNRTQSTLRKLNTMQNEALRVVTGCLQ